MNENPARTIGDNIDGDDIVEQPPLHTNPRRRSRKLPIILLGIGLAVGGLVVWAIVKQNDRPDFNADVKSPEIDQVERPINEDWRGGFTDLFFDHPIEEARHPLDPALLVAEEGLKHFRKTIRDYTAVVAKQERVNGELLEKEFFECKVRQPSTDGKSKQPKSFYLKFVKPKRMAGREVIWVEGQNGNRLTAHEGGLLGMVKVNLNPTDRLAMMGNRYPITELGLETLIVRMIEKGRRDRKLGNCEVTVDRSLEYNGHKATVITITHPEKSKEFEFYQAKIYIDDELNLPVGYEGFLWPEKPEGPPVLLESYFYSDLKVNVGLKDLDFDVNNPAYKFP